ncbi:MAG TPA: glycosyltransferase family 2 protein [Candidatus Dormibacteraeota bacterium]|nr:glycosyltransferase family 2 protein [Candidatus Dormibacteraeota bacterium]
MLALEIVFWCCVGLLVYTHVGYPLTLLVLSRLRRTDPLPGSGAELPTVSLIVAAYDEEAVIEQKVHNALALDYPRERFELIVASDGSEDRTAELAQAAGAEVLELPRMGKAAAQDEAVARASGEIVAFSDANSLWAPDALRTLVAPLSDPGVGYVCGQVRFTQRAGGTNEEGAYWRYEMAVRALESRLGGITAGNGAIYAIRRAEHVAGDPYTGDLSLPFRTAKRGQRAVYVPAALAEEPMVPSLEGEFRRKRRMMARAWGTVLRGGMLSPRGYPALFAFEIASHRLIRYASPFLHLVALGTNIALLGHGWIYAVTLGLQIALLLAAALAPLIPFRPFRLASYYVLTTGSIGVGLIDWLRGGTPLVWEKER